VIEFLCASGNQRLIYFLWRPLLPDPKDDFVLELAVEAGPISRLPSTPETSRAPSASGFGDSAAGAPCNNKREAMTLNVTVPDLMYRQIAELAARQQVSL
jgi:hypothetical protein